MDLSLLTLKVILLIVPGVICCLIYNRLTIRPDKRSEFHFAILSIVFGMASYVILQLFYWEGGKFHTLDTFKKIGDDTIIPYIEIKWASIIAVFLGLLLTVIDTYKLIERVAYRLKFSKSTGNENLFTTFTSENEGEWVYIRDISNNLSYKGKIIGYNELSDLREIILDDVTVFDYPTSNLLYPMSKVYLSLDKNNLKIETP
jgi:hypothetical protein